MIEIIKATFTAGEIKTYLIQGEYLEILEAAYPVDIAMMDRSGAQLSTMRNAEASYFSRPGKYEVIQVTSTQAQTVRLFVGSGDAGTRRTSGDVSVVDGGKNRSIAGNTFVSLLYSNAPVNCLATVQLFNPANSGKNVIVQQFNFSVTQPCGIRIGYNNAAIGPANNAIAKKAGSANATSGAATSNALTAPPAGFVYWEVFYVQANVPQFIPTREPFILPPGFGLILQSDAGTLVLAGNIEIVEELI